MRYPLKPYFSHERAPVYNGICSRQLCVHVLLAISDKNLFKTDSLAIECNFWILSLLKSGNFLNTDYFLSPFCTCPDHSGTLKTRHSKSTDFFSGHVCSDFGSNTVLLLSSLLHPLYFADTFFFMCTIYILWKKTNRRILVCRVKSYPILSKSFQYRQKDLVCLFTSPFEFTASKCNKHVKVNDDTTVHCVFNWSFKYPMIIGFIDYNQLNFGVFMNCIIYLQQLSRVVCKCTVKPVSNISWIKILHVFNNSCRQSSIIQ